MKKLCICLTALVLLTGCTQKTTEPKTTNQPCSIEEPCTSEQPSSTSTPSTTPTLSSNNPTPADMSGYEGFTDLENQFVSTSLQAVFDGIKNQESMLVYFGKISCPWCVEAIPVLNQVAKENQVLILYVDVAAPENGDDQLREQLLTQFAGWLEKDEEGKERFYVPDVATLVKGEIQANHIATVDSHEAHERKMNEKEIAQLRQIYEEMVKPLVKK